MGQRIYRTARVIGFEDGRLGIGWDSIGICGYKSEKGPSPPCLVQKCSNLIFLIFLHSGVIGVWFVEDEKKKRPV